MSCALAKILILSACLMSGEALAAPPKVNNLLWRTDTAKFIVMGVLTDTTYVRCRGSQFICTKFTLEVDDVLKGNPANSIDFLRTEGVLGKRFEYGLGDSILAFLAPCRSVSDDEGGLLPIWSVFVVQGDSIFQSGNSMSIAAVRSLISNRLASVSPDSLAEQAEMVAHGTFGGASLTVDHATWQRSGTVAMIVDSVLFQVDGPEVARDDTLSVRFAPSIAAGDTSPPFSKEGVPTSATLFLSWTGSEWEVIPTIYAAWWTTGDTASVYTEPANCTGTIFELAKRSVDDLWDMIVN